MAGKIPDQARVVIIGGGIAGASVAYHLTKAGWTDVLLLERKVLTCGTTWHAAGLVGQLRATENLTRLAKYGAELYGTLEEETGQATGFQRRGSIAVARTEARWTELKRGMSMARAFDVDVEEISLAEAKDKWPLMETSDLVGALYIPGDGQTNPTDTTMALAKGSRMRGAKIVEGVKVTGLSIADGTHGMRRVTGVETDAGNIACEYVVNCGGMWGRELGQMAGVPVPLHAAEHIYVVTTPMEGVRPDFPTLRDPDAHIYIKEDAGKLLVGCFEPDCKPWGMDGIPEDFEFDSFQEDWDHFAPVMEMAMERVPALAETGIRQFFVGPESFTPDTAYILGEAPNVKNFFVAAGFNSIGIASAAGAGKVITDWIVEGHPGMDLWDVDVRRFHPKQTDADYLRDRTTESLGMLYAMHWPYLQPETGRNLRQSPLHEKMVAARACFGVVAGYERPNWFAPEGVEPKYEYAYGRQNWFPYAAEEHQAVREAVGLFDQCSFAKILVEGKDALGLLQELCANDVDVPELKLVYTAMLNARGTMEADLTVTRLGADRFLVITACASFVHDYWWICRHAEGKDLTVSDVTEAWPTIGVMGPNSRDLLGGLTDAALGNNGFPFATAQRIEIAGLPVLAARITYMGELGWELNLDAEAAGPDGIGKLHDALVAAGGGHGLRHAGYHALHSLRMEKAYRSWGHDLGVEDTPLEAGLGFAVAWDKAGGFLGREPLLAQKEAGLEKRLVQFTLDDPEPLLFHDEVVWRDGARVGTVASGDYGHHLGCAVALSYVRKPEGGTIDADWIKSGSYEIEIAGEMFPATAHLTPAYDPKSERVKA